LYNNLGYAQLERAKIAEAIVSFDAAVQRNDRSQIIYWNRATAHWRWAQGRGQPIAEQALVDIRKAIDLGPPAARIYLNAALMHYWGSAGDNADEQRREQGLSFLLEAIRLGSDLQQMQKIGVVPSMLAVLRERGQLEDAEGQGAAAPFYEPERVIDSLEGLAIESL
jgi:hypothetical protein